MPTPSSPPTDPADVSDADIRTLLAHRATVAAAELADPTGAEAQAYLAGILAADPAEVRKHLTAG
jgi:hypothetical protein